MKRSVCFWRNITRAVIVGAVLAAGLLALAADRSAAGGEKTVREPVKALLISLERYEKVPLKYANEDLDAFSGVLTRRFNAIVEQIVDMPAGTKPSEYKSAIEERIKNWCDGIEDGDTAILYIAGHGYQHEEKLYLPMINFDSQRLEETAIPLIWIRETYAAAKGKCKLIFLDACYSGTSRGISVEGVEICGTGAMASAFDGADGVTTVASGRADQESYLWNLAKHSFFTYWLIEAFRGYADLDNDHFITFSELTEYLSDNVSTVSQYYEDHPEKPDNELIKRQDPVVLNGENSEKLRLPVAAYLGLGSTMQEIAAEIGLTMRLEEYKSILVVPEFGTGSDGKTVDQSEYGQLPATAAAKLRNSLEKIAKPSKFEDYYKVASETATKDEFQERGITSGTLGGKGTSGITIGTTPIEVVAAGSVELYAPMALRVTVDLFDAKEQRKIDSYTRTCLLTEADAAALGFSFGGTTDSQNETIVSEFSGDSVMREVEGTGLWAAASDAVRIEALAENIQADNPMRDSDLPFEIQIETRKAGSKDTFVLRRGAFISDDYYVPLNAGEEFRIILKRKCEYGCFAKVLIGGRNTLAQPLALVEKGAVIERAESPRGEIVSAPRVSLSDARAWDITWDKDDPKDQELMEKYRIGEDVRYEIMFKNPEKNTKSYCVVKDSFDDVSPTDEYKDQLGLITAAFYRYPSGRGEKTDISVDPGDEIPAEPTRYSKNGPPGERIAVCNIRYVSQKMFDELMKKEKEKLLSE